MTARPSDNGFPEKSWPYTKKHDVSASSSDELLCDWFNDEGVQQTGCNNNFILNEGTPKENGMIYCCYCGKKIKGT